MKPYQMKAQLLKIIRSNFDIECKGCRWHACPKNKPIYGIENGNTSLFIVEMIEAIYPQGKSYTILRHAKKNNYQKLKRNEKIIIAF
jgi:hypothetical protein